MEILGMSAGEVRSTMESDWTALKIIKGALFIWTFTFACVATAQDIEAFQKGVVRIITTSETENQKTGSGFVVSQRPNLVVIVTAAHVVEGAREIKVEFFTRRNRLVPAKIISLEGGERGGLAALSVTGDIPTDISVLRMESAVPVRATDTVTMIGFPRSAGAWAVTKGEIAGRNGKVITFSGAVDEGSSGGPLIKEGQVIGVVTEAISPFAYAVPAVIAQYTLESWGVKFAVQLRSTPATLQETFIKKMIREKGFSNPQEAGGLEGVIGNFQHEYEPQTIEGQKVVVDHATGLMWQQSGHNDRNVYISRKKAQDYIAHLNSTRFAGYSEWRLPTVEELASLMEPLGQNEGVYISPFFDARVSRCLSADAFMFPDGVSRAYWVVEFRTGRTRQGPIENDYWLVDVKGVRSTK